MTDNKTYIINSDEAGEIQFSPDSVIEEVLQNLSMVMAVVKGTVPLDRGFGISGGFIDKPLPVAEAMIQSELLDAVEQYEPRAEIVNTSYNYNEQSGKVTMIMEVTIDDGQ